MSHVPTRASPDPLLSDDQNTTRRELPLGPPFLWELPYELLVNDECYRRTGRPLRARLRLHGSWIVFRLAYYSGWRSGRRASDLAPHLRLR